MLRDWAFGVLGSRRRRKPSFGQGRRHSGLAQGWRKPRQSETSLKIFPPDLRPYLDFSRGTAGWDLPAGYSFDAHGGRHGGQCLVYTRADGGKYTFGGISFPTSKLVPGATYCFGCWIKTERVHGSGGAGIIVEFLGPDGYVGGFTPIDQGKGVFGNSDWTWFEGRFIIPPAARVRRPALAQRWCRGKSLVRGADAIRPVRASRGRPGASARAVA